MAERSRRLFTGSGGFFLVCLFGSNLDSGSSLPPRLLSPEVVDSVSKEFFG